MADPEILNGEGRKGALYFIANAHNELYAFYVGNGNLLKILWCRWGGGGGRPIALPLESATVNYRVDVQLRYSNIIVAATTRVWNSLPADFRNAELSYSRFRRSLKTFLFRQSDHGALWTLLFLTEPCRNICTYLFTYMLVCSIGETHYKNKPTSVILRARNRNWPSQLQDGFHRKHKLYVMRKSFPRLGGWPGAQR